MLKIVDAAGLQSGLLTNDSAWFLARLHYSLRLLKRANEESL